MQGLAPWRVWVICREVKESVLTLLGFLVLDESCAQAMTLFMGMEQLFLHFPSF